jgi:hypothetical protein
MRDDEAKNFEITHIEDNKKVQKCVIIIKNHVSQKKQHHTLYSSSNLENSMQ